MYKFFIIISFSLLIFSCGSKDNAPPWLKSIANQSTNQGVNKTLTITSSDPDGDTLTYSLTSKPSKVTGSVKGSKLTLVPASSYTGTAALTLTVSDGKHAVEQGFDLVVSADDPLYKYQWHLNNRGQSNFSSRGGKSRQDINVDSTIADGYTGNDIIVAIVDSGLELTHEDLAENIVSGGSWDYNGSDSDPTNSSTTGDHGTSVAGLIASVGWNAKGGRGVAPSASLKGFNFLQSGSTASNIKSHGAASYSADVDIFNQSYGVSSAEDYRITKTVEAQFLSGVTSLRGGKGAIYIKSAGNGFDVVQLGEYLYSCDTLWGFTTNLTCQNANVDVENTLPYNIVVGALDATGVKSSYSTTGSALWVSAPGGEYGTSKPAMMTTDQSGCSTGYVHDNTVSGNGFDNSSGGRPHAKNVSCKYTATFNGTSSAAPVTSGAVALILEANPNLTWRDVKHILATTSDQVDASISDVNVTIDGVSYTAEPAWLTNSAGHKFHNYYGFGRVNVGRAIAAAKTYTAGSLGTFYTSEWIMTDNFDLPIPDNNASGVSDVVRFRDNKTIEAVQIVVGVDTDASEDLAIELTSPAGTKSVLFSPYNIFIVRGGRGSNTKCCIHNMVLLSNAFYGEPARGNWTIKVIDAASGPVRPEPPWLSDWKLRIFGH